MIKDFHRLIPGFVTLGVRCEDCKKSICSIMELGKYRCEGWLKVFEGLVYCLDCAPLRHVQFDAKRAIMRGSL